MFTQDFNIIATRDRDIESKNYGKIIAFRYPNTSNHNNIWTDNIFLAKHYTSTRDVLNVFYKYFRDNEDSVFICKVHIDPEANMKIIGEYKGSYEITTEYGEETNK